MRLFPLPVSALVLVTLSACSHTKPLEPGITADEAVAAAEEEKARSDERAAKRGGNKPRTTGRASFDPDANPAE